MVGSGHREVVVDPGVHFEELLRFEQNVVRGPGAQDCAIWCSAIGADGYGPILVTQGRHTDHGARQPLRAGGRAGR